MSLLLHISDTHFGTEKPDVVAALLQLASAQKPDVVVLSGDITQRATRAQYAAAARFVAQLAPAPVVAIPGNHDIPLFDLASRVLWPYARYARAFGRELEPCFDTPDVRVIGVNTTRWYRHQDGAVSARQVERVARLLAQARPAQWRIVLVHQPVAVTLPQDETNRLHGADTALARWGAAGADMIVGGHIHLPFVRALHQTHGLARPLWAVQAGTAVSWRVRPQAGNSVNVIRLRARDAHAGRVERWDHAPASGRFERAETHELARG